MRISHHIWKNGIPLKITHNNPPPPKYVVSSQHSVKVFQRYNFHRTLVLMGLRTQKIVAPSFAQQKHVLLLQIWVRHSL